MGQILEKSIKQLANDLRSGAYSVEEVIKAAYERIETYNPKLNALITPVDRDTALEQARQAQKRLADTSSPLCGLPYVLKDSYVTTDLPTTAASNILKDYLPTYNATVHQRLQAAGAILVGKANMDAWGHGATSENSDFGPVKNPWSVDHVAGGSSGGCAAAVASRMAVFAIGEDTGGSIRNPAAWNNVTGLKVTYGRVSRYGCIAYASSFDTVGPMAKTAEDCAYVLEAIAGQDPFDASSAPEKVPAYSQQLSASVQDTVVGLPQELFTDVIKPEVKAGLEKVVDQLTSLGIKIEAVSMPTLDFALAVYYLIAPSETSSNLARYDGVRYGQDRSHFRPENKRRIMIGSYALSAGYYDAYYRKALKARTLLIRDYQKALQKCQALLMPITTSAATKLGKAIQDPLENMMIDLFTTSQNPAGLPALAIPAGFTQENLPFGVQLVANRFDETTLFTLAHAYQQQTQWHERIPQMITN